VLTKIHRDLITDLAEARNTSAPVTETTLADLRDELNWLKEELQRYPGVVRYKQFGNEPVDARTVIALLTLFDVEHYDANSQPVQAYTSKAKCLDYFRDHDRQQAYQSLRPVIHDILKMYDYIRYTMRDCYNNQGGRFMRLKPIKAEKMPLYFWKGPTGHEGFLDMTIHDALVYPALASLRFLLKADEQNSGKLKWKVNDIFAFWDKYGGDLVKITFETCRTLGNNLSATAKNTNLWQQLYDRVKSAYFDLISANLNQDVIVPPAAPGVGQRP
jgi:hypothetical protein